MSAPLAIDCFCGAGGLSLGLVRAGFRLGAAFDAMAQAVATYRDNLGDHVLQCHAEDLDGSELLAMAGCEPGACALVAGGPPCQGFSAQRRGADDDARNQLIFTFLDLVAEIRPQLFLMENVPPLAGRRGAPLLARFRQRARGGGYRVSVHLLDAADYGVPQHRRRAFVVGERDDRPACFQVPAPRCSAADRHTVRQAIGDLPCPFEQPELAARLPNHRPDRISSLNRHRIAQVPPGGGRADIPEALRLPCHQVSVERAGHRGVYGRLHWDRPAGTITTKCNSFTRGRFAHPDKHRNITMREAARLQSFPDDFVFAGGTVPVAHQVGNAVPPLLAEQLGSSLLRVLAQRAGAVS